jgi:exosortase/archaeosortase family protein
MSARYSRSLKFQKTHFLVGLGISLFFTLIVAFYGFSFWIWQAYAVSCLLSFAGVPHKLLILGSMGRGPTFEMLVNSQPLPLFATMFALIVLASLIVFLSFFKRIPSPVKTIALVVSAVTILTLLWQTLIAPMPSSNLHWVTLDWSCSGIIGLCLITLLYAPLLFTIRGPLYIKVFWLSIAIAFSICWNLVRMSLVTATLYYFGGSVFLIFHYLTGAFVDFIYIVAFYSLALANLSKFEIGRMMRFDI